METIIHSELADQVRDYVGNLRSVFAQIVKKTKAKDGRLVAPEILQVQRLLGMNPTESEIHEMIYTHDVDGSMRISENDFVSAMVEKAEISDSRHEITEIFQMFDKDGNGVIDTTELKNMFEYACGPNTGISMSEITDLLEELDIDGDSLLNYEEFVKIFAMPTRDEDEEEKSSKGSVTSDV